MSRSIFRFMILAAALCTSGAALRSAPVPPNRHGASADRAYGPALADPAGGDAEQFFQSAHVYTVELTITPVEFAKMPPVNGRGGRGMGGWGATAGEHGSGYPKVPAQLRFEGRNWGTVMIRYKGNSSYRGAPTELKRSIKIDFNVRGEHRHFFGLSKLNLNNNAFDSSELRETLAYDVFRNADVPAPRTALARVYISVPGEHRHEYAGLYTIVEEIDQTFFLQRWHHKVGVLVKPEGLSGLPDLGNEWKTYETSYDEKVAAKPRDAARLMAFIQFVDHASDADFAAHLDDYLDVDEFLHFLAAEVVTVNSDSPLAMNHNYYLTVHPGTHKVEWIPWDMNMAFGGFRRGEVNLAIDRPSAPGMFPLADRILSIPALRHRYDAVVRQMLEKDFTIERLDAQIGRLGAVIRPAVAQDPSTSLQQLQINLAQHPPERVLVGPGAEGIGRQAQFGWGFRDRNGPPLRHFIDQRVVSVREQLAGMRLGVPGRAGFGFNPNWGQ